MRQVDGAKVARFTLGGLPRCPAWGRAVCYRHRKVRDGAAEVSRGHGSRRHRSTKGRRSSAGKGPSFRWRQEPQETGLR